MWRHKDFILNRPTHHSRFRRFTWQQAVEWSPLLHSAVVWGPHVSAQDIAFQTLFLISHTYRRFCKWFAVLTVSRTVYTRSVYSPVIGQVFKMVSDLCYTSVWIYRCRRDKWAQLPLLAHITHHIPTHNVMSRDCWIYVILSERLCLLFWDVVYPMRYNKLSPINGMSVGSMSSAFILWIYQTQHLVVSLFYGPRHKVCTWHL